MEEYWRQGRGSEPRSETSSLVTTNFLWIHVQCYLDWIHFLKKFICTLFTENKTKQKQIKNKSQQILNQNWIYSGRCDNSSSTLRANLYKRNYYIHRNSSLNVEIFYFFEVEVEVNRVSGKPGTGKPGNRKVGFMPGFPEPGNRGFRLR